VRVRRGCPPPRITIAGGPGGPWMKMKIYFTLFLSSYFNLQCVPHHTCVCVRRGCTLSNNCSARARCHWMKAKVFFRPPWVSSLTTMGSTLQIFLGSSQHGTLKYVKKKKNTSVRAFAILTDGPVLEKHTSLLVWGRVLARWPLEARVCW